MTSNSTQGGAWDSDGQGGSGVGGVYDADYDEPYEVSVNNGLTLNAVRQSVAGENYVNGALTPQTFPVAAGVVDTYGKTEFDGGYLAITMKQPAGDGAWPSLWLLPGAGAGDVGNNFEIDIQEGGYADGNANPDDVLAYHLHTSAGTFGGVIDTGVNLTAAFHTYAIDWIPGQSITWYFDGKAVAEITSAQAPIPDEPMELVMSNQVATQAASSWRTSLDSSTPASMPMQVSGVQLYQTPGSGETITGGNVSATTIPSAPVVAITTVGAITDKAAQTISGTVDLADTGSTVNVYDGAVEIGSAKVGPKGKWWTSVTLVHQGINVLTAVDTNAAGAGTAKPVNLTLHTRAPSVAITTPAGTTSQASQTISGTVDVADAGSKVAIYDGKSSIGTATVGATGKWSASVTLTHIGANIITAKDSNVAGTGTSAAVDFVRTQSIVTNIANSSSGQTYALGDQNYNVTLGGFANMVSAGDGNDKISPGAGNETVRLGNGADSVTLNGYSNSVTAGNGADKVTGGLGGAAVKLGDGANNVSLGGYNNVVVVGDGANTLHAGAGAASITAGAGANIVSLDGFYNCVQLGAGKDVVNGGQGYDSITLSGGSSTLNLPGVEERVSVNDGANVDIFDVGAGLNVNIASSLDTVIVNGLANDASAVISLSHGAGGYASVSDVLGALQSDGHGGSLLSLHGGSVDMTGVAPSQLGASHFSV